MVSNTNKIKIWFLTISKIKLLLLLVFVIFGFVIYTLNLQIQALNLELKNLTLLLQSLNDAQNDLKDQLLIKNQQIRILENSLIELQFKLSSLSYVNHTPQNFEKLKEEILEINKNEIIQFGLKISGVVISLFLVFCIINFFGKPISQENLEINLIDSLNELIWSVKIIDNQKAQILMKNFVTEEYELIEQLAKTLVLKSSDSITSESFENFELINSQISANETAVVTTQIIEIISSFGIF